MRHGIMAQAHQASNDIDEAVKFFARAAKASPDDKGVAAQLDKAKKVQLEERKKQAEKFKRAFG